ncbi:hypothetical protein PsorP6_016528 [Peronosclerospora sorghi]|uniref:Uncharacterized protein n=1 Tax=Peronosclerospora sorghi TaxID=230839 RepID=A0ACC0VID8_9STRA|nr:hypothetical protein PsorP6_016528 [Peronosclerospora sorghi]
MCSASMEELATAVELLQGVDNYKEVVRHLLCLSERSYQASRLMVCHSHLMGVVLVQSDILLRIVLVTGRDFQEMVNYLLPHIISTAKNSSDAIRQPGAKLLNQMSKIVRYDLADEEVLPWESDVLEII